MVGVLKFLVQEVFFVKYLQILKATSKKLGGRNF